MNYKRYENVHAFNAENVAMSQVNKARVQNY